MVGTATVRGAPVWTLQRASLLGPGESVVANECPLVRGMGLHGHDFYEIAMVASGRGMHLCGSWWASLSPGDVLFINPALPHAFSVEGGQPLVVRNVIFTEAALEAALGHAEVVAALALFHRCGGPSGVVHLHVGQPGVQGVPGAHPLDLAAAMIGEFKQKRPGYRVVLEGYLLALLGTLWRIGGGTAEEASASMTVWQRLLPALGQIFATAGAEVKVADLARHCGWSEEHFRRLFKSATGQTLRCFMRQVRARHAASLLSSTDLGLEEVAARSGYGDARALRRAFAACFGVSPGGFRRRAGA